MAGGVPGFNTTTPPPESGTSTSGAIGVPDNYTPPLKTTTNPWNMLPRSVTTIDTMPRSITGQHPNLYTDNDALAPLNQPPSDISQLQQAMIQAGVLDPSNTRPGVWDNSSISAYKQVLAFANSTGSTAKDALDYLVSHPQLNSGKTFAPLQVQNPADIQAAVQGGGVGSENIAQRLTGKDLSAGESADFVKYYQQQEETARQQYMQQSLAGQGGAYTGPPSIDAAAQAYIKQHNLADTVAYGTAARMLQFYGMLKSPV